MSTNKVIKKRGFTVLEVCMVLVIMGLIVASIVPSFNILYKQRAKQFANTFVLDMEKQWAKGRALSKVKYYIKLIDTGTPTTVTISGVTATGYNSYIVGNTELVGDPAISEPSVPLYTSDPYTGTHPKVTMGMLLGDTDDAAGREIYFDRKGAYILDPSGNRVDISKITLGVCIDGEETYRVTIDGVTGKTTWTLL